MFSYLIFVLPALILSMYAQSKVQSTFARYSGVPNSRGITANQVAEALLRSAGITDVAIEHVAGNLTDHYDPRTKTIRLSDAVFGKTSIAALGVAAHETGHACQHHESYAPLNFRSAFVPVASFGSKLSMPMIMLGLFLGNAGQFFVFLGIVLFTAAVLFQIVTLPVEFNASNRALQMVEANGLLSEGETDQAGQVLKAAALTYVAAAAVAIGQLLQLIMVYGRRNRQ